MKVLLMHPDRDSAPHQLRRELVYRNRDMAQLQHPSHIQAMIEDLELNTVLGAMSGGDEFLFEVAEKALLSGVQNDAATILYRQQNLNDCLNNETTIRQFYALTAGATEENKKHWWGLSSRYASSVLHNSIELLESSLANLRKLRVITTEEGGGFKSPGFLRLFAMLREELGDEYLAVVRNHLAELTFRKGALLSAQLGGWNESTSLLLRKVPHKKQSWFTRILDRRPSRFIFHLHPRDEAGSRILSEMQQRGISRAVVALAESSNHVLNFLKTLRTELAFYVGCLNLRAKLTAKGEPLCFPIPHLPDERKHKFQGLYDVCLSLQIEPRVVGNTADAEGKDIVVITGANQGGKSTFLRSIGAAQLMMQCGMFVGAEGFEAELCPSLFTHYKREEDITMKSGKLDEELARMSAIIDLISPNSIVLFNESFSATNEREGSEIAKQIVCALLEKGVKVFFVTHLYEFARGFYDKNSPVGLFLRAERTPDGTRTFKMLEGEPLTTSFGGDLYRQIFAAGSSSELIV